MFGTSYLVIICYLVLDYWVLVLIWNLVIGYSTLSGPLWFTLNRLTAIKLFMVFYRFFRELFSELKTFLVIIGSRPIQDLYARLNNFKSHLFEGFVSLLDRSTAPAKAPERPH